MGTGGGRYLSGGSRKGVVQTVFIFKHSSQLLNFLNEATHIVYVYPMESPQVSQDRHASWWCGRVWRAHATSWAEPQ